MLTTLMYTSPRTLSLLVNYLPVVFYTLHTCAMCGPWTQPAASFMGACRGARGGALAPPGIWKKKWRHIQNALNFSLAPSALAIDTCTLYFSLKRRKKRKNFRLRLRRTEKWSIFCTARRKPVIFLKCRWFCLPLEKFLRAPMASLNRCSSDYNWLLAVKLCMHFNSSVSIRRVGCFLLLHKRRHVLTTKRNS